MASRFQLMNFLPEFVLGGWPLFIISSTLNAMLRIQGGDQWNRPVQLEIYSTSQTLAFHSPPTEKLSSPISSGVPQVYADGKILSSRERPHPNATRRSA